MYYRTAPILPGVQVMRRILLLIALLVAPTATAHAQDTRYANKRVPFEPFEQGRTCPGRRVRGVRGASRPNEPAVIS